MRRSRRSNLHESIYERRRRFQLEEKSRGRPYRCARQSPFMVLRASDGMHALRSMR
jgi:hypothetical protein